VYVLSGPAIGNLEDGCVVCVREGVCVCVLSDVRELGLESS